ncbi:MAG TPA: DUF1634 domain-containing protein [Chloroflexia bacterium]|nr:DUF1634 domain-containing protein [Chloroflexia bacterium]
MDDRDEHLLYEGVRRTLVGGLVLSFGLMGLGLGGLLLQPGAVADAARVVPLARLPGALLGLRPAALLDLGVLVLMGIPVVHLGVALRGFARRGEVRYAGAALLVLGLLAASAGLAFWP